jgi:ribonuclease P protein component
MKLTFNKHEKLKSKKLIQLLFKEGKSITAFPLRLMYLEVEHDSDYLVQAGVTVSKKKFALAVDRNRIKRLMREAYRLNKPILHEKVNKKYIFMFMYLSNKEEKYDVFDKKTKLLLEKFIEKNN